MGRRTVLVTGGFAGLAVLGAVWGFHLAGDEPAGAPSSPAGSGALPGSVAASGRREVDLTSRAVAEASAAPSTLSPSGELVQFPADNVIDGDPASAWRTAGPGDGQVLTLTFPREVEVSRVGLAVGEPDRDAPSGTPAPLRGRSVQQVTWEVGGVSVVQRLAPGAGEVQFVPLTEPLRGRTLTLRVDRTAPGPVGTDDFSAVTQVVVFGVRGAG